MRLFFSITIAVVLSTAILCTLELVVPTASAQTTTSIFSYQGSLVDNGSGVNADRARFVFELWDSAVGGRRIGSDVVVYPVVVVEGVFTAYLDFGEEAFDGTARYLRIGVDAIGGTQYVWLDPRQPVTAAPFAVHALHGGDNPWVITGDDLHYESGNVGIGTSTPASPLHVAADVNAAAVQATNAGNGGQAMGLMGQLDADDGYGVHGKAASSFGTGIGVYGLAISSEAIGVKGYCGATSGNPIGVYGQSRAMGGYGVFGRNSSSSGSAIGVRGESGSATGFGGYFLGRGYFSDRLGIGTTSPATELDVNGTVRMNGFQLNSGGQSGYVLQSDANGQGTWQPSPSVGGYWEEGSDAGDITYTGGNVGIGNTDPAYPLQVDGWIAGDGVLSDVLKTYDFQLLPGGSGGYVLTSDASGYGTWQPASGFTLPYTDSVSSAGTAFSISNSGSSMGSHAIRATITNPGSSSDAAAGFFDADGTHGHAISAFSDGGTTVTADHDGSSWAFYGTSTGDGSAFFSANGYGGHGVKANTSGENGNAIYATASGGGAAIYADASGSSTIGLIAKGSSSAAKFYGNVAVYEFGTTNKVIELGKGLDYAEGFDITESDDVDIPKGTVLVIDPDNPGQLTRCRQAYDRRVAGIVAGAQGLGSGVRLGAGQFDHDVALAGRVYCNVVATDSDIEPGDLLTTSDLPGYAMKVREADRAPGAVLGKAMEPLAQGEKGQILVLVTLQ